MKIERLKYEDTETPSIVVAKACGPKDYDKSSDKSNKKITYSVSEEYHSLSLDRHHLI
jgi:hypothetical protein